MTTFVPEVQQLVSSVQRHLQTFVHSGKYGSAYAFLEQRLYIIQIIKHDFFMVVNGLYVDHRLLTF